MRALQTDYAARIRHFARLEIEETRLGEAGPKPRGQMTSSERWLIGKTASSHRVVLDQRGQEWSSADFARWLGAREIEGGKEIAFLLGGPDGFSDPFRANAEVLLSLSRLTLTRDWSRTLLLEQIYRGFTTIRGYPYPR